MSIFDTINKGRAVILELPIYRDIGTVVKISRADADGFLLPDLPTGRLGPDGLALPYRLSGVDPGRFILAQAAGRRDMSSNLSRIKGGLLLGIDTFYIVRGDVDKGCGVAPTKLISRVKELFPEARLGATISPGRHGEEKLLLKKLKSGTDFFITQICFDVEKLLELVRKVGLNKPLLIALAVNFGHENLKRMEELGITISSEMKKRLSEDIRSESLKLAVELSRKFLESYEGPGGVYLVPFGDVEEAAKAIGKFK